MDISATEKAIERRVKQHLLGKVQTFFAVIQPGFEKSALKELNEIGINDISEIVEGGIEFNSKIEGCYKANICSRIINRIYMRLFKFKAERFNKFQKKIKEFPWELYLKDQVQIKVNVKTKESRLYHTKRIEEELLTGINKRLSDFNKKISTSNDSTPQMIFIRIEKNICQINLDTTGELLYKRGNKPYVIKAPLRENIAASILLEADIQRYDILLDPMCGSGTFSIEGADIIHRKNPNADRFFIFMNWPAFKEKSFNHLKKIVNEKKSPETISIIASDIDEYAVETSRKNFALSKIYSNVKLYNEDFFSFNFNLPENKKILIVLNSPYGKRIKEESTKKLFFNIGKVIREKYSSSGYAIITPGLEYEKIINLNYDKKILFMNGGIKAALIIKYL